MYPLTCLEPPPPALPSRLLAPSPPRSLPFLPACCLQEQLTDAKILYSSATGASEPKNLAYMTRLGLFGFKDAGDMIDLLSK